MSLQSAGESKIPVLTGGVPLRLLSAGGLSVLGPCSVSECLSNLLFLKGHQSDWASLALNVNSGVFRIKTSVYKAGTQQTHHRCQH